MSFISMVERQGTSFIVRSLVTGETRYVLDEENHQPLRLENSIGSQAVMETFVAAETTDATVTAQQQATILVAQKSADTPAQQECVADTFCKAQQAGVVDASCKAQQENVVDASFIAQKEVVKAAAFTAQEQVAVVAAAARRCSGSIDTRQQAVVVATDPQCSALALEQQIECLPQHKIKRSYKCEHCTYLTLNPRLYLTHLRDTHGERIEIHKCTLCMYASKNFQTLLRHMKLVHGCKEDESDWELRDMTKEERIRKLVESLALKRFPKKKERKEAVNVGEMLVKLKQEEERKEQEVSDMWKAAYGCPFISPEEKQLQPEQASSLPKTNTNCCKKSNSTTTKSSGHRMNSHSKTEVFRCDQCEYVVHSRELIVKHMRSHASKTFSCMYCDFKSLYKANLMRHLPRHFKTVKEYKMWVAKNEVGAKGNEKQQ